MSRTRTIVAAAFLPAALIATAAGAQSFGQPASEAQIADHDLIVSPDGRNLPPGSGSVSDGLTVYTQKCLACHGENGQGGPMDRLSGGMGTIGSDHPIKTISSYWPFATTVFDYVRRAMPLNAPQSLTNDEVYAVTAYLLSLDGIVGENAVMNAETLPQVEMPNRDGFIWAKQPGE
jgi:mono/diheme cytochrome c family protein